MKVNIAIVAGGNSGEYEVSLKSAAVVAKHLDHDIFDAFIIIIRGDEWTYTAADGKDYLVNKGDFSISIPTGRITFGCAFIAIHGTPGEDGILQGYFDLLKIPYTSSGQAASALTFNKFFCNRYVRALGVTVSDSILIRKEDQYNENEILNQLGLPVFVKPNRGGSSVGTSKVKELSALKKAIDLALKEDDQVLIEAFIPGREITCGVITYKGKPRALPITEIVSRKEFFDYEAKYQGKSEEITPAKLLSGVGLACKETSLMLYNQLNCKGMTRFDYIFNEKGLYFLEVNTVPGLSEASIVPQQAIADGISLKELFTEVVLNALNT